MTNAEADNGTAVVAVAFSLLTLSSIVIALRLWVRQTRVSGLRIDDYLVITAWVRFVQTSLNVDLSNESRLAASSKWHFTPSLGHTALADTLTH